MNATAETVTVVTERDLPHAPEKVWRALSRQHLMAEWLMTNDFEPVMGHRFKFTADWGSVDCQVTAIEPAKTLVFTWTAYGLENGGHLEPHTPPRRGPICGWSRPVSGPTCPRPSTAPRFGWAKFADALEKTVAGLD